MNFLLSVLTLGLLPALWLSGYALLGWLGKGTGLPYARPVIWCLAPAVSLPAWSLAMTASAYLGLFHAPTWGALGWVACIPLAPSIWRQRQLGHRQATSTRLVFAVVLLGGFVMYAGFPHDSFFVGRDQATYANQALHIARSGELGLESPMEIADPQLREVVRRGNAATGLYSEKSQLTVQFSPVLPVWLAVAFSALGIIGLQAFNATVAVLSAGLFFGLAARLMSRRVALAALVLFTFNPMQIWVSRVTLSEILAQYLGLAGILLLFGARRRRPEPFWILGGLTLGASVFVRIDGFVLAPLAMASAWLVRSISSGETASIDRARSLGTLALLFVLAMGVPFYYFTSAPYLEAQSKNLIPIAACAALFALLWWRRLGSRALVYLTRQRAFWIAVGAALLATGLAAYFIRPRWEPFHYYTRLTSVLYGSRDFRENSFVNLGLYVTPVLAFMALAGFWKLLQRALTARSRDALTLLLVSTGGYALLYLYNPSISPDHPWGMRRFVPLVIPGVILLGSFVLDQLREVDRLRRHHLALTLAVTAALVGYPNFRTRAGLFLREYAGAYSFVTAVADAIPQRALLLCDLTPRLFGHLALGRQLRTVRIAFRKDSERLEAAQTVLAGALRPDEPYYVLVDDPQKLPGEKPIQTFKAKFKWLAETTEPPASTLREARFSFYLFERRGPLTEPGRYLAGLGMKPIDGVREGGFWPVEDDAGSRTRWTQAEAWLEIPLERGWSPRTFALDIAAVAPTGTWLTVRANDKDIYNAMIKTAPVSLSLRLPPKLRKRLRLELVSDTFIPSDVDERALGVRIKSMTLR
ncbi:MAG TPA: hypothetical protein VNN80_21980 [Polyangiaceae bacterium]|nr:hypothetical protein [Polyangiaceae bacterium]